MAKRKSTVAQVQPAPPVVPEVPADQAMMDLRNLSGQIQHTAQSDVVPAAPPAFAANELNQDPQLIQDFLVEAREHLTNVEGRLLEIEQGVHTAETLHSAFRSFHTLKGLAGFLDFAVLQEVAHEVESLLDLARNGNLVLGPATVDVVLQSGDYLGVWLNYIESSANAKPATIPDDHIPLVERIRAAAVPAATVDPDCEARSSPVAEASAKATAEESTAVGEAAGGVRRNESALVKVDTSKLEYLVDMVGELVIAQSMLRHNPEIGGVRSPRLQRDIAHLTRITAEVQKTAMAMRMVPIGQLFRRMTRLVRDLARKSGKHAELELIGEDVQLDRNIVEELADPLVHMLRNSMDHGLEGPDERQAAGKPAAGRVRLKASHQAGLIVIELTDDGRGLNRQKILEKAIQRGVVKPDAQLTDSEIHQLIFEPGFSTADKVTDVSGRGVGMDVVRRNINKLRGRIEIVSSCGTGTTFLLKLPLTLAIIDGLVVVVGQDRYIVPIFAVREMFRPARENLFTVEGRGEMAMVRQKLLPVVRLSRRLGVAAKSEDPCEGLMIVGESDSKTFCLLVDELAGKQEVVIKNLGTTFRDVRGIAGGAILGDGRVGLILDLPTLVGGLAHAA
ncbi:MAG TPA: chemotaxis protein CheA [Paludibaculum sp.]|jgi:two-component system chemotaxis sensor kinase CheA